ncbi:peptide ABC transporter ATP-binding protein [Anaerofilum sp. An201]|nr:ABC transporter ATP-binding protein [Anaerofilum sp. An201]OUP05084.1 peptide ABC transporter ATP-binding protein [Anaerofilum sp. An201]
MAFLQAEHLDKVYGSGDAQVHALRDVSFEVHKGEFVAIVGPSGSGKSTLMHLLGGIERPTGGRLELAGVEMFRQKEEALTIFRRRQIGLVYQFYNLVPLLTVRENLALPLLLDGREPAPGQMEGLVEALGLQEKLNAFPAQLSGGQQQRVAIGRALIARPALLLADEPTGNLDTENTVQVMELLRRANRDGQTIVMITHNPDLALQADRVMTIRDGRLARDEVRR